MLDKYPVNEDFLPTAIQILLEHKDIDRAKKCFLDNYSLFKNKSEIYQYIKNISWTLFDNNKNAELQDFLISLTGTCPLDEELLKILLESLIKTKDTEKAKTYFLENYSLIKDKAEIYRYIKSISWLIFDTKNYEEMQNFLLPLSLEYPFDEELLKIFLESLLETKQTEKAKNYFFENYTLIKDESEICRYIKNISWTLFDNQDYKNLQGFLVYFASKGYVDDEIINIFSNLCEATNNVKLLLWFTDNAKSFGKLNEDSFMKLKATCFLKENNTSEYALKVYEYFFNKYGYNDYIYDYLSLLEKFNKHKKILQVYACLNKNNKLFGNDLWYYRYLIDLYEENVSIGAKYSFNRESWNRLTETVAYKKRLKDNLQIKLFAENKDHVVDIPAKASFNKQYDNFGVQTDYFIGKSNYFDFSVKNNGNNNDLGYKGEVYFEKSNGANIRASYNYNDFFDGAVDGLIENLAKDQIDFNIYTPVYKKRLYAGYNFVNELFLNKDKLKLVKKDSNELFLTFLPNEISKYQFYNFSVKYRTIDSSRYNEEIESSIASGMKSGNVVLGNVLLNFNITKSAKLYVNYERETNTENFYGSDYLNTSVDYWLSKNLIFQVYFEAIKGDSITNYLSEDYTTSATLKLYF